MLCNLPRGNVMLKKGIGSLSFFALWHLTSTRSFPSGDGINFGVLRMLVHADKLTASFAQIGFSERAKDTRALRQTARENKNWSLFIYQ